MATRAAERQEAIQLSTVDCLCTSVQFFITKREGAAVIGVAYSTGQLETKTKEKITGGLGDLQCRKVYCRSGLQEVSDVQFPDIRHHLILKLLPGNKAQNCVVIQMHKNTAMSPKNYFIVKVTLQRFLNIRGTQLSSELQLRCTPLELSLHCFNTFLLKFSQLTFGDFQFEFFLDLGKILLPNAKPISSAEENLRKCKDKKLNKNKMVSCKGLFCKRLSSGLILVDWQCYGFIIFQSKELHLKYPPIQRNPTSENLNNCSRLPSCIQQLVLLPQIMHSLHRD